MKPDCELLRQYAEEGDEAAFAEVVQRHVSLVHASAVRLLNGNTTMAQDVTQVVFTDLARKAGGLSQHTSVAGWLHTSVRFAAANAVRSEQRRRLREQESSAMSDQTNPNESAWMQMRPLIDEAVGQLHEPEREAVLLRFFEEKSHREVGAALGLTENAARMRVERGLEKLRAHLARYGVTASVVILAATLSSHAASGPAPAGFAASIAGKALLGSSLPASGTGLGKAGSHTLLSTKAQVTIAGTLALASAAAAVLIFSQSGLGARPSIKHSVVTAPPAPMIAPASVLTSAQANSATPLVVTTAAAAMSAAAATTGSDLLQTVTQDAAPLVANNADQAPADNAPVTNDDSPAADNSVPSAPSEPQSNPAPATPDAAPIVVATSSTAPSISNYHEKIAQWSPRVGGNGHYYIVVAEPSGITWSAAQSLAVQRGGHLATVATPDENDFVFSLVNSPEVWSLSADKKALRGPWLGGTHSGDAIDMNYGWQWVNNVGAFSYSNWALNEPSTQGNRLHFFAWGDNRESTWDNDQANTLMPGYVVEFDQKPRLASTGAGFPVQPVAAQSQNLIVPRGTIPGIPGNNRGGLIRPVIPFGLQSRTLPGGQRGPGLAPSPGFRGSTPLTLTQGVPIAQQ